MTTGKTGEPEPDYVRIEAEFTRLEREVVEKAKAFGKAWRAWLQRPRGANEVTVGALLNEASETRIQLCDSLAALESFEAKQK